MLLIVFFSHPRYDVNLDYYKEVYAEFFPNVSILSYASLNSKMGYSEEDLVDGFRRPKK